MHDSVLARLTVFALVVFFLSEGPSFGQDSNPIDANNDGILTDEEQMTYKVRVVKDTNGDGIISYEEELPFWKVRYEFESWPGKECPLREQFNLKETYLPEWESSDNILQFFRSRMIKGLEVNVRIFNLHNGSEAQEELLQKMTGGMTGGTQYHLERIDIGTVGFYYVDDNGIWICFQQDNVVVEVIYTHASKESNRDVMIGKYLSGAKTLANRIRTLILEVPVKEEAKKQ